MAGSSAPPPALLGGWVSGIIREYAPRFGLVIAEIEVRLNVSGMGDRLCTVLWDGEGSAVHHADWRFDPAPKRSELQWRLLVCHELAERRLLEYQPEIEEKEREALADVWAQSVVVA